MTKDEKMFLEALTWLEAHKDAGAVSYRKMEAIVRMFDLVARKVFEENFEDHESAYRILKNREIKEAIEKSKEAIEKSKEAIEKSRRQ